MSQSKQRTKGAVTVELAFALPFLLLLTLGALHYGWLFYHLHRVTNATRHAARVGTLAGRTHQDVKDAITAVLGLNNPGKWPNYSLNVDDPAEVNIQDVPIMVDGGSVPGIRVGISLPTARNPGVLLIGRIPFGPLAPENLAATVIMAKEGG